jgi:hypothetical protein
MPALLAYLRLAAAALRQRLAQARREADVATEKPRRFRRAAVTSATTGGEPHGTGRPQDDSAGLVGAA